MDVSQSPRIVIDESRSARELMLAGEWFCTPDLELARMRFRSQALQRRFNDCSVLAFKEQQALLAKLLKRVGLNSWIEPNFYCDYGVHIEIGDEVFINMNCTFLDANRILIGDRTYLSPGVQLMTTAHPLDPRARTVRIDARLKCVQRAAPIVLGNDVWIGAGAVLLGGVEVGDGSVIGAGSVVTRSIPAGVLAAGNPCRIIRSVYE
ncbi:MULTISPECIES: sugar O-acetyltransferase [Pseudomonas]|uniref:sugar O-acetyltransferase n=1 Tax=Pseudomonas TaxID=286 RepID=UPI000C9A8C2B|nr:MULTISPECIES: sugar O-acetyltransferase [Pseudomonas]AXK57082.1 sugar O-acetyltransferase [Pseudomonas protegens]MBS7561973.1 sugar O-acetyltransferase [Pseudomonas sp. RC4D1]MBW8353560.1 sugar O-acetyltransferase [Pseudomonas sp.]MCL9657771.1 sugar O-acetyltransferase [Pseudomonas protegens]MCO7578621.1 sugar O-acetyltransferase [Pseudomonas protegens]